WVSCVVFSPDGKTLATGGADGTVRLWDPLTGAARAALKANGAVSCVAFAPDGKALTAGTAALATGSGTPLTRFVPGDGVGEVKEGEVPTGKELNPLKGHARGVLSVAFSPDGPLATAGADGVVMIWQGARGKGPASAVLRRQGTPVFSV